MANVTKPFKTPLLELSWVSITAPGKLKMNAEDNGDPANYQYTATVIYPNKEAIAKDKAIFDKFWKENRPAGATRQSYTMFKPETEPVLDAEGKPQEDDEGAIIKRETGRWLLNAKTITVWPRDGKPNKVKVLRANGNPLDLGDKQIGNGSTGVLHCTLGINGFPGNEGLALYLNAIQLKKLVPFTGSDNVEADDLGETEGTDNLDIDAADISDKPAV